MNVFRTTLDFWQFVKVKKVAFGPQNPPLYATVVEKARRKAFRLSGSIFGRWILPYI